jgi:hypothetical protein
MVYSVIVKNTLKSDFNLNNIIFKKIHFLFGEIS